MIEVPSVPTDTMAYTYEWENGKSYILLDWLTLKKVNLFIYFWAFVYLLQLEYQDHWLSNCFVQHHCGAEHHFRRTNSKSYSHY